MKTYIYILLAFCLLSCEDVVDVDVPQSSPKLVIEATIEWEKGTVGNEQEIKLSLSTPYFSNEQFVPATGAQVIIRKLSDNTTFVFSESTEGIYTTNTFNPELNTVYELEILYGNEVYKGQEEFKSVSDINSITQTVEGGFDDELIEVNIFFDDPEDEENYYLTRFNEPGDVLPYYFPLDDEFTNGNEMTMFYEKEDGDNENDELNEGDLVEIELSGISERYYNYMSLLLQQADDQGPFGVTPAPVIGNCVNETNEEAKPYGYFRLSEVVKTSYIIQ
ncbi:DUF4249 domain-containing protein [Pseudofulvibacter geojedonensis]|uniref:DUF4249 domain-containing protein n=1 Tax=Pseudofulvibacter geojedonensis TaxID=1123758 RepID=A0ABW3I1Q8_9FLAO